MVGDAASTPSATATAGRPMSTSDLRSAWQILLRNFAGPSYPCC